MFYYFKNFDYAIQFKILLVNILCSEVCTFVIHMHRQDLFV